MKRLMQNLGYTFTNIDMLHLEFPELEYEQLEEKLFLNIKK